MTEHKHTPGPWTITHAIIGSSEPVKHPSAIVASPSGSVDTICDFDWMTRRGITEQQSNAALIAAAPDLLAALEAVVDCHAALTRHVGHSDDAAVCLVTARAAIAKAKEGSHD